MTRWEYITVTLSGYEYEKVRQLNRLWDSGWELVSRKGDYCTFKRKVE